MDLANSFYFFGVKPVNIHRWAKLSSSIKNYNDSRCKILPSESSGQPLKPLMEREKSSPKKRGKGLKRTSMVVVFYVFRDKVSAEVCVVITFFLFEMKVDASFILI